MSIRLLLTYANQEDNLLEHLNSEYVGINELVQRSGYPVDMMPFAKRDRIVKKLIEYRNSLELFSYSGHVGGGYLITEGHTTNPEGIAGLLKDCPNIKVVLLNGCSTKDQVKMLKAAGVPVVIYTHTSIYDELAKNFATTFFHSLLNGETLNQAFTDAKNAVNAAKGINSPILFQQKRGLELDDIEDEQWGIYPEEGTDLNWTLDFVSEFRKPIYENATKLLFVGDNKEGKQFYQRVKGAFVQEETDKEYILNDLWGNGGQIVVPSAVDEIKAADILIILVSGLQFNNFWKSNELVIQALEIYRKPWILIYTTGVEVPINAITASLDMYSARVPDYLEIFADLPPTKVDNFISTGFKRQLKEEATRIIEGKIPHQKLREDLDEFDLDTPTEVFKTVLQENKLFHLVFLQGTPQCGLELLVRRIRGQLPHVNNHPFIVSFLSQEGSLTTEEALFKKISRYLDLNGDESIGYIATTLCYKLKKSQVVLVFDNVIDSSMDQATVHNNLEIINQFWITICKELEKEKADQLNRLFVLALNKDYCANKQFKPFPSVYNLNATIALLPPIELINEKDIRGWYEKKRLKFPESKFDLIDQHLDEITGDGFLANVLHRLCVKIECKKVYANLKRL